MEDVVIVAAARTAVGKFGGSLSKVPAPELGATVVKALLERIYARGWARRLEGTRVVAFSAPGLAAFRQAFPESPG